MNLSVLTLPAARRLNIQKLGRAWHSTNLLHEEFLEQRQRQRDPLKIGMMVLGALGGLMFLYYMWNAYQALGIRNQRNALQQDWSKIEPTVTAAQKRSAELNNIIGTTKVLDGIIDNRFFWAPFLEKLSRCVAPNAQITSVDGTILEDNKSVNVMIEGMASGREPRAAAEELRQLLLEQLGQSYREGEGRIQDPRRPGHAREYGRWRQHGNGARFGLKRGFNSIPQRREGSHPIHAAPGLQGMKKLAT